MGNGMIGLNRRLSMLVYVSRSLFAWVRPISITIPGFQRQNRWRPWRIPAKNGAAPLPMQFKNVRAQASCVADTGVQNFARRGLSSSGMLCGV